MNFKLSLLLGVLHTVAAGIVLLHRRRAKTYKKFESVNFQFTRVCNYACKFCFHTATSSRMATLDDSKKVLRMLADSGMKKINFAGGEPFMKPEHLGEMVRYCKEELPMVMVTIVTNGSKVTEEWMEEYGKFLDMMAVSCDSCDDCVNSEIGRLDKSDQRSQTSIIRFVAAMCRKYNVQLKMNTVVCTLNAGEDMNAFIDEIQPVRWKVFQVLRIEGENAGEGALRQVAPLLITDKVYQAFLQRHSRQGALVPEDNDTMRDSYILVDEDMCFLDNSTGAKVKSKSILTCGVEKAFASTKFDEKAFKRRNGDFYRQEQLTDVEDIAA